MDSAATHSRDLAIEDPSNRWLIHPFARALLPFAVRFRISPNAISIAGLVAGALAALAYFGFRDWPLATAGFALMIGWHVLDGLDGMVARATGKTSDTGRLLDGLCDISAFMLVYAALAAALAGEGQPNWWLAFGGGVAHMVQSAIYEGERDRFHALGRGEILPSWQPSAAGGIGERLYVAFRRAHGGRPDRVADVAAYRNAAIPVMRAMIPLSANARTLAIWIACLCNRPDLFWWWEIIVLTPLCLIGVIALRGVEKSGQASKAMKPF